MTILSLENEDAGRSPFTPVKIPPSHATHQCSHSASYIHIDEVECPRSDAVLTRRFYSTWTGRDLPPDGSPDLYLNARLT